jgi:hypothetical protein
MKTIVTLFLTALICGCGGDFSAIDAEVEIVGSLPPAVASPEPSTVLYRVVAPAELAGRYGVDHTKISADEIEKRRGGIFEIRRTEKWRHLLTATAPTKASVSAGEDFFESAIRK